MSHLEVTHDHYCHLPNLEKELSPGHLLNNGQLHRRSNKLSRVDVLWAREALLSCAWVMWTP